MFSMPLQSPKKYYGLFNFNLIFLIVSFPFSPYNILIYRKGPKPMKKPGYYSSGEFARMAHVTLRTIRYYDKHNILRPSLVNDAGSRFYTDEDFVKLQQVLLLKYLGFSLDDIRDMTIDDSDYHFMLNSLNIQLKLIQDRIEQMQLVKKAIQDTASVIQAERSIDWSRMLNLIHLTGIEKSLKNQYQNASNISSRINLHHLYSQNPQGWFPWIYEHCHIRSGMNILEIGCGDGTLWTDNLSLIPEDITITLSDISEGMLRDTRRALSAENTHFSFETFDCHQIPHQDESFDLVIANHVLFYCKDISQVCCEIQRVLKPGGQLLCSTYGSNHMKEVSQLVQTYDRRIALSADRLYERFGRENGDAILKPYFTQIKWELYEDFLLVTDSEPLIFYILSCHGNQNQYLLDHYKNFHSYVKEKTSGGFRITKDAGIFLCIK
jgi:ubiquinone/menaquinone biosynthesis C-methylase UbiE/DNA-binding transcriptional MerR regulator